MTSEQKEAFLNSWFGSLPECSGHWTHGMSGNLVDEVNARFDEAIQAYTRAVPDVPELVRYGAGGIMWGIDSPDGAQPTPNGEYVRYDQAAAMLAAKDAEIELLRKNNVDLATVLAISTQKIEDQKIDFNKYCAQIKAQKPVGYFYRHGTGLYMHTDGAFKTEANVFPLYIAPVDQTAEIERLREAAQKVIDRWDTPNWKEAAPTADVMNELRDALSGKGNP